MNSDFTFVIDEGDYAKLQRILYGMSEVDQQAVVQTALRMGMQRIVLAGKSNLSMKNKKKTGNLSKSFSIRANKKKAYTLGGFRRPAGAHAHLIDRGTDNRWTKKGYYRGSVSKGSPNIGSSFWTTAVMTEGPKAQAGLMDAIYDALDKIIRRNL